MTIKLTLIKALKFLLVLSALLCLSFLNYLLMQIFGVWPLPLTLVPVVIANALGYNLPINLLLIIGISDDVLSNGFLGLYPALYIFIEYLISEQLVEYRANKLFIISFFLLFFGINILTFLL